MSNTLLKIYGFFIIVTLLLLNTIINKSRGGDRQIISPISHVSKNNKEGVSVSDLTNQISTTSKSEISTLEKTTLNATVTPFITATIATQSNNPNHPQIPEIDESQKDTRTSAQKPNPCLTPITYTIGRFDPKFNISKNYFIQKLTDASTLWNNAAEKKLFEYAPNGNERSITVDLVYDSRQRNTDENKLLGSEIQNSKDAARALQTEYEALKITFTQRKEEYTQKIETLNTKQKIHNDTIISWNEKGGAPRAEYEALTAEEETLIKESGALALEYKTLTSMLNEINTKITRHNELVLFANERVTINNTTSNKKFTEGNYDPGTNKITIYQFSDETKLKRVLAHEFGHALGIDHNKNKLSIMYAVNSATTTNLSKEDVQEIKDLCP